ETEYDIRDVILGHTMRAGTPNAFDRVLGVRLGVQAAKLVVEKKFGQMVCLKGENIGSVPLTKGAQKKLIPKNSDLFEVADLITKVKYTKSA
ncbi:MAG: 6-phosphofructokinase, partial [Candidatus Hodarchaeales archaeon]